MDCAGRQTVGEADETGIVAPEYDFARGIIVRQHADDDLAFEKLGDIRRGLKIKRLKLLHLIWTTNVSGHTSAGGGKICGHCRAHATETNKANVT
jgi:hypothetical protein